MNAKPNVEQLENRLTPVTLGDMATFIVNSSEYRENLVKSNCAHFLHRDPSAEDLTYWSTQLTSLTTDQFVAALLDSHEYNRKEGNPVKPIKASLGRPVIEAIRELNYEIGGDEWLQKLYQDVFNRDVDGEGLAYWTTQLQTKSRGNVALEILSGLEANRNEVQGVYLSLFNRTPSVGEADYWAVQNLDLRTLQVQFIVTPEFQVDLGREAIIAKVYNVTLKREPDEVGAAFWDALLDGSSEPLVNDPTKDLRAYRTQSESAVIALGDNVVAMYNDSGSWSGQFVGDINFTGYSLSTDGGKTWRDMGSLPAGEFGGHLGDPVLAINEEKGEIYATTLGVGGLGINLNVPPGILFYVSKDGGVSWENPVIVTGSEFINTTSNFLDKEWLAVDTKNNVIYVGYRVFGLNFDDGMWVSRSIDGGKTFEEPVRLTGSDALEGRDLGTQGIYPFVAPDGTLHVYWLNTVFASDGVRVLRNDVVERVSRDFGKTYEPEHVLFTLRTKGVSGDLALVTGQRTNAFVQVAQANNGVLVMTYNDVGEVGDKSNVYVRTSLDGVTWSDEVQVNNDEGVSPQYQPTIATNEDKVMVSYYSNEFDADAQKLYDYMARLGVVNDDGTITWQPFTRRLTKVSSPVVRGTDPAVNPAYASDFEQANKTRDGFITTWMDGRFSSQDVRVATMTY